MKDIIRVKFITRHYSLILHRGTSFFFMSLTVFISKFLKAFKTDCAEKKKNDKNNFLDLNFSCDTCTHLRCCVFWKSFPFKRMDYERNEVDMKHGLSEFQEQTATLLVWSSYNSSGFQIVWLVRTIYLHKKKRVKKKKVRVQTIFSTSKIFTWICVWCAKALGHWNVLILGYRSVYKGQ